VAALAQALRHRALAADRAGALAPVQTIAMRDIPCNPGQDSPAVYSRVHLLPNTMSGMSKKCHSWCTAEAPRVQKHEMLLACSDSLADMHHVRPPAGGPGHAGGHRARKSGRSAGCAPAAATALARAARRRLQRPGRQRAARAGRAAAAAAAAGLRAAGRGGGRRAAVGAAHGAPCAAATHAAAMPAYITWRIGGRCNHACLSGCSCVGDADRRGQGQRSGRADLWGAAARRPGEALHSLV
jgi:hypothetical protein